MTDARNQADGLVYQIEKTLNENREKIPAADISRIESSIAALKKASEGDDAAAIRKGDGGPAEGVARHGRGALQAGRSRAARRGAPAGRGRRRAARRCAGGGASGDVIDAEVVDDEKK